MRSSKSRSLLLIFWVATHTFVWSAQSTGPLVLIQDQSPVKKSKKAGTPAVIRPRKKAESKRVITIGQSAALSGNLQKYQQEITFGIEACLGKINHHGGIRGHKIALKVLNNNSNPAQAAANVEQFLEDGIDILLGCAGNRNIKAILPYVKNRKAALCFPWGCSLDVDNSSIPYMVHGQTTQRLHIRKLVSYLANDLHHTRIGIVHSDSSFGVMNAKYAQQLFATYTADPIEVTLCSYNSNTADVTDALATLNKVKPHAILFLSTSRPTAKIIKGIGEAGNYASDFVGNESNYFAPQQLDSRDIKFHYSSAVPALDQVQYPIVQEYLEASRKYTPRAMPNSLSFTYYINTKLLSLGIDAVLAEGGTVTRDTIITALDKIVNKDIGGFIGSFNRDKRTLYPINVGIVKGSP
jgi:branched-chain amino acid transport system substrate-binding protein